MAMTAMPTCTSGTSTPPDTPDIILRQRAAEDGCLVVPGLLPADAVRAARHDAATVCARHGLLDPGRPMDEAMVRPGLGRFVEDGSSAAWKSFYNDLQRLRSLHALNQHPTLLAFCSCVFGEPAFAHPRMIARALLPGSAADTTPPHQDHFYIGGTIETWTAWIPLGDCDDELGGLALAPGTHRKGLLPVHQARGAGGRACGAEGLDWVARPLAAGDVLLLHSLCIHQGRDNRSPDRMRLSVDCRFQPVSHPVGQPSLEVHMGRMSWDEVYRDWPTDDPLRYYWRDLPLTVVPR